MKKGLILICLILLLFASCQNNGYIGELFGRWKLSVIETGAVKIRSDSVFYAFQSNVINVKKLKPNHDLSFDNFGEFWHIGDTLKVRMYNFPVERCREIALNDTIESFHVELLTWKKMILKSAIGGQRLYFEKY